MSAAQSGSLSTEEKRFLDLLPETGVSVGNVYLRRALSVDEHDYWRVRDSLVARGLVGVGRGRGGSAFRVTKDESEPVVIDLDEGGVHAEALAITAAGLNAEFSETAAHTLRPVIEAVEVQNFKRIEDASIDLTPVTILVGGNNSGKSSFLQAIHTAVSCAQESQLVGRVVVSEANLRYSPTHDFSLLGHKIPYENRQNGSRGSVKFTGRPASDRGQSVDYTIKMYKGANHKNVGVDRSGVSAGFGSIISDHANLFSVYVPGLSGVLLHEESHAYASIFMRAARGDANLVFRNIIERLILDNKKQKLEGYLSQVFGYQVTLRLDSQPEKDLYVDVRMARGTSPEETDFLPVELWGMGVLQVTQLFAYALLFEPEILLVDEPDSHVHPSSQKSLMTALGRIADELQCRIIVSTHSRHLVSSAPEGTAIVWMKDGEIVDYSDGSVIPLLIDIGALDQFDLDADILLATEDKETDMLERAISELEDGNRIRLASFNGLGNAVNAKVFNTVSGVVKYGPKIVIHRDRDFLTDEELASWSSEYEAANIAVFCPQYCDVEYYHTTPRHIAKVTGMPIDEAKTLRETVLDSLFPKLKDKFENKRKYANQKLWPSGGSPVNADLWDGDKPIPEEYIYGKDLLNGLIGSLKRNNVYRNSDRLDAVPSEELTEELRAFLDRLP